MKRIISVFLVVILMVICVSVTAVADSCYHYPRAEFEHYLDREGRLILDGSCSKGDIEEYYWEIRGDKYGYLVERGHTRIFQTSIYENYYGSGRYRVTLTVTDQHGYEDSITEKVIIPQKYQRHRRGHKKEIGLTIELTCELTGELTGKEKMIAGLFFIGLAIILSK